MNSLPKGVQVGAHPFSVEYDRSLADRGKDGECYAPRCNIRIAENLAPSVEQVTTLHEVLHAVWADTPLNTDDTLAEYEEQVVTALAPLLLQVVQDNPEFMEYLRSPEFQP